MAVAAPRSSKSSRDSPPAEPIRTRGFAVIKWIEWHCVHTQAEWIGRPFRLLTWQKLWILLLFAVDPAGVRIIRWALLGVPKKNGKTELLAALALYLLIGDGEPSPLVVIAAASDEQADLAFGAAATMCRQSKTLSQITEVYDREILVPSIPGAKLKRVAAAAGTNDGQNIHAVICDELHEWTGTKGRQVWTVLTNGTGARRQPLVLQATTAGFDMEGTVCGQQYTYGQSVADGEVEDPHYLMEWIQAPDGCDYRDPEMWRVANPSWGITIPDPDEFFRDQLTKKTESEFRRYFLNQWVEAADLWEPATLWDGLKGPAELNPALPLYVGVDVGVKHDCSAVVWAQVQEGKRVVLRSRVWENPWAPESRQHQAWRPARTKGVMGPAFMYDPHFFERSAQMLTGDGLNMLEFPQSDARMIPASQSLFELVKQGTVMHDGDPALRRHIRNVVAETKPRGWRISKPPGSRRHIDAAVATAIAVFEAARTLPTRTPVGVDFARELLAEQGGQI